MEAEKITEKVMNILEKTGDCLAEYDTLIRATVGYTLTELRTFDLERIRNCREKFNPYWIDKTYYCNESRRLKDKCQACQRDIQKWKELGRPFTGEELK